MLENHLDAGTGSCIDVSVSLDARDASDVFIDAVGTIDACDGARDGDGAASLHADAGGSRGVEMHRRGGVYILADPPPELAHATFSS